MPFNLLLSKVRLTNWATYPIVLLSVDRNLRAVAANSPADAARLQQEERLRMPGLRGTQAAPKADHGGMAEASSSIS